jgi:hypothetical protein
MVNIWSITPHQVFILGVIIVSSYIILFGFSLHHSFIKDSEKDEDTIVKKICCNNTLETILLIDKEGNHDDSQPFLSIEKLSATFGIIVAGVVGYYFGQRQSEASGKIADAAIGELKTRTEKFDRDLNNTARISELTSELDENENDDTVDIIDDTEYDKKL